MKRFAPFLALLLFAASGGMVLAHSELIQSEPAPGDELAISPAEIRLTFSEPVAADSQIILLAGTFTPIAGLVSQIDPEQPEVLFTPLPLLEAATYTVQWTAVSDDGHEISGSYSFSVGPTTQNDAGTSTDDQADAWSAWWMIALGIGAVGLLLLGFVLRRGRRE